MAAQVLKRLAMRVPGLHTLLTRLEYGAIILGIEPQKCGARAICCEGEGTSKAVIALQVFLTV